MAWLIQRHGRSRSRNLQQEVPPANVTVLYSLVCRAGYQLLFRSTICRKCNFHLWHIASIRGYILKAVHHRLAIALAISNFNYCNALLLDIPGYLLRHLHVVHHWASCLVTLTGPWDYITPVMEALHWLPVSHRIIFKMLLYVYQALNGVAQGTWARPSG